MLDGASRLSIFWKVLLPLTMPGAVDARRCSPSSARWNDYWWPLISATRSDMYTLTVGLASSQMNYAQTSGLGFLMAQAVFASIPIFIVYSCSRSRSCGRWPGPRCDERAAGYAWCWRLLLGGCSEASEREGIYLQRFFGECGAVYGTHDRRRQGRGRVRHHHHDDQQLQRREPRQRRSARMSSPGPAIRN